ncbi:MAG: NmrA family NAD(P)-binding protein [Saprospiraceae bacterium]
MVLIVGSTGLVGTEICHLFSKQNIPFRAMVRKDSASEKVDIIKSLTTDFVVADLKDPTSLDASCKGIDSIISTVSCTFTARDGDTIETVDHQGQLALVLAAQHAGVKKFVFISFADNKSYPNPLSDAKRAVEKALISSQSMTGISLQANYFMEIWLSPAIGFDYQNAKARIYGAGENKLSWISYKDVAKAAVAAIGSDVHFSGIINIAGPEALSPNEVIQLFEKAQNKIFEVEYIPVSALQEQMTNADHPMQKSFTGLMLQYAEGLRMDPKDTIKLARGHLTLIEDYIKVVSDLI